MRQEIALAKAEISDSAKKAGKGAGLLGGAGYAGLMAVFFLSVALMVGLGYLFDNQAWGAVVVAVIWAVIGLVMYLQGRKQLTTVQGAPRTAESVKKIPEAMKRNEADR
ncbi:phage holin family protein [Clavibacter zhangzhiyongii]|uniref:phage holin family protein n=1 Tax=Clavibacter zhangzhiyongii TaxID=2768071 RepID=UPI0039DFA3D0